MPNWKDACPLISKIGLDAKASLGATGIYADSLNEVQGSYAFMVKEENAKKLVILGKGPAYEAFSGAEETIVKATGATSAQAIPVKICPLNHANAVALRKLFPFTAPSAVLEEKRSIGLGDRLGLASAGHIRLIKNHDVKPILAQQSMRELNLTGRNYEGVLDDASWAVYQEGYKGGFGADGDHLKKPEEVQMAIDCGFTMITLDCSEHIDNSVTGMTDAQVDSAYAAIGESAGNTTSGNAAAANAAAANAAAANAAAANAAAGNAAAANAAAANAAAEGKYLNKEFKLNGGKGPVLTFGEMELKRIVLTYGKAIAFASEIYHTIISKYAGAVSFEISIDETLTPTSPQAHFYVATELAARGVKAATVAPRFCGEFQKGIDYIGDLAQFDAEFKVHAAIADEFGYKISVHSGSDKFSVFPTVGRETKDHFHVKTAGTNWLEAVRVIAIKDPALYREIHMFALSVLDEAKKYYHIGADVKKIAALDTLSDAELPALMDKDDSRQVIHITYGLILQAKKADGTPLFKDRMYQLLHDHEEEYYARLVHHIGRHLSGLGIK